MALISHRYKFLYFLNPRTASTATSMFLKEIAEGESIPQENILDEGGKILVPSKHTRLDQLVKHGLINDEIRQTYLKFVTVRNPFDSVVSLWAKLNNDYVALLENKNSWVHKKPDYKKRLEASIGLSFPEWVRLQHKERIETGATANANGPFIRNMDVTLRFESLQEDFSKVAERLGLPGDHILPKKNVTQGRSNSDYRQYYDDETREIIATVFAPELEKLGYEF